MNEMDNVFASRNFITPMHFMHHASVIIELPLPPVPKEKKFVPPCKRIIHLNLTTHTHTHICVCKNWIKHDMVVDTINRNIELSIGSFFTGQHHQYICWELCSHIL